MFIISLLSRLPLNILYKISSVLAFIAHRVMRYRLKVAKYNIALCFPNKSEEERKQIIKEFYRHLADVIVEAVWFGGCHNNNRFKQQHILEMVNPEVINEYSEGNRSIMLLNSHMGNWELIGGLLKCNYTDTPIPIREDNIVVTFKPLKDKRWNEFMHNNRTAVLDNPESYEGYLESRKVLRYVITHQDKQKFYCFITDQRPYKTAKGTLNVNFLGQPCQTMAGGAQLAHKFGFSVVYLRMMQTSHGHYIYEYVPICADASTISPQEIMNRYYELLSADIEEQPSQYLWTHKRFRKA